MGTVNPKTTTHTHTHTHRKSNLNTTLRMVIKPQRKGRKKTYKNKPQTIKKMAIGTYTLKITLNVNGLSAPIERHRLAE